MPKKYIYALSGRRIEVCESTLEDKDWYSYCSPDEFEPTPEYYMVVMFRIISSIRLDFSNAILYSSISIKLMYITLS